MPVVPAPRPGTYPHHYQPYVDAVPPGDLLVHLETQLERLRAFVGQVSRDREDHTYEAGKWTVKEVVAHVMDTERILAYRLLCIARGEEASLPGFDQDAYVMAAQVADRSLESLIEETATVRAATVSLLAHLPADALDAMGTANHHLMCAGAIACAIYAHFQHHLDVLRTRYLD